MTTKTPRKPRTNRVTRNQTAPKPVAAVEPTPVEIVLHARKLENGVIVLPLENHAVAPLFDTANSVSLVAHRVSPTLGAEGANYEFQTVPISAFNAANANEAQLSAYAVLQNLGLARGLLQRADTTLDQVAYLNHVQEAQVSAPFPALLERAIGALHGVRTGVRPTAEVVEYAEQIVIRLLNLPHEQLAQLNDWVAALEQKPAEPEMPPAVRG